MFTTYGDLVDFTSAGWSGYTQDEQVETLAQPSVNEPVEPTMGSADEAVFGAIERQARAASAIVSGHQWPTGAHAGTVATAASPVTDSGNGTDPAQWLSGQLAAFVSGESVDPYAELMLRSAGFAPVAR